MKGKRIVSSVVVVGLLLGLVAGISLAQGSAPQGVPVGTAFTYQGRLTDASGPGAAPVGHPVPPVGNLPVAADLR
jgi:hypothetical protein